MPRAERILDAKTGTISDGWPKTRTLFPGLHIRPEGAPIRNGINFYPLSAWGSSRGFIARVGWLKYRLRYSVAQRRFCRGWERRIG